MIRFKEITVRNFLSFGNEPQTVDLDQGGIVAFVGENKDTAEFTRNGCGKSAIVDALVYALYGRSIRNIPNRLLPNKKRRRGHPMIVQLDFTDGDNDYRIVRGESPSRFEFFCKPVDDERDITHEEGGVPIFSVKRNKAESLKDIENVVGLDRRMFMRLVVNTSETQSFMDLTSKEQREVMEHLFGLDVMTEKAERAKEIRKSLKMDIAKEEADISARERERDNYIRMYEAEIDRQKRMAVEREQRIRELEKYLKDIDITASLFDDEYWRRKSDWENIQGRLEEIQKGIPVKETLMRSIVNEANGYKRQISSIEKQITDLEQEYEKAVSNVCPTCEREWSPSEKYLSETKGKFEKLFSEKMELLSKIKELRNQYAEIKKEMNLLQSEQTDLMKKLQDCDSYFINRFGKTVGHIDEGILNERDKIVSQIEEMKAFVGNSEEENEILGRLHELKSVEIDRSRLEDLNERLQYVELLIHQLQSNDSWLRRRMMDYWLGDMNRKLADLTVRMDLPYEVQIAEDLSVEITRHGDTYGWGNLSRGQRQRASIAFDIAMRRINAKTTGGYNMVFIDEMLDNGLDSQGARQVMDVLSSDDAEGVFIVTHRSDIADMADRVVKVVLKHGVSRLEVT